MLVFIWRNFVTVKRFGTAYIETLKRDFGIYKKEEVQLAEQ